MKRTTTSKKSAPSRIPDDEITFTEEHWKNAEYRVAGRKVTKAEWQKAARAQLGELPSKKRISIMLDAAIIEHFKTAAGERGYQTLINDTLRRAVEGQSLVTELRTVVQQELAAYKIR